MSIDGVWNISMKTPMGQMEGDLTLVTSGTALTGSLTGPNGPEPLIEGVVKGNDLSWAIKLSKPIKVTVHYTATVEGDSINGKAKLGIFGSAPMVGTRAATVPAEDQA
jgi:hypothetical protein